MKVETLVITVVFPVSPSNPRLDPTPPTFHLNQSVTNHLAEFMGEKKGCDEFRALKHLVVLVPTPGWVISRALGPTKAVWARWVYLILTGVCCLLPQPSLSLWDKASPLLFSSPS